MATRIFDIVRSYRTAKIITKFQLFTCVNAEMQPSELSAFLHANTLFVN